MPEFSFYLCAWLTYFSDRTAVTFDIPAITFEHELMLSCCHSCFVVVVIVTISWLYSAPALAPAVFALQIRQNLDPAGFPKSKSGTALLIDLFIDSLIDWLIDSAGWQRGADTKRRNSRRRISWQSRRRGWFVRKDLSVTNDNRLHSRAIRASTDGLAACH